MTRKQCNISSLRKAMKFLLVATIAFAASTFVMSCDNDNDDVFPIFPLNRPNALVTVKPSADGTTFFMQLDDSTKINASNIKQAPYGSKEVQ